MCLKMSAKPLFTQSGFADHYPVLKNGYFIGNIDPTFSDKAIFSIQACVNRDDFPAPGPLVIFFGAKRPMV